MTRPTLLAVGEAGSPTGYARAMECALRGGLADAFETTLFAVNRRGPGSGGFSAAEQLPEVLATVDPDVVLLQGNSDAYLSYRFALEPYRARRPDARVAVWTPLDWPELAPAIPLSLARADLVVAYTEHGRRKLERAFLSVRVPAPRTAAIPLPVESDAFSPLPRAEARRRLLDHGVSVPQGAFVVLNANRNQRRKQIDVTMRAFARFAAGRPDARLYLHMGMRDLGCDVLGLASELGIEGRLITTTAAAGHPDVSDAVLGLIYNACDVGVNTAAAEGFGLVSFEHAAAGAAQIVPAVGACAELWKAAALPGGDEDQVADALCRLHDDPALLARLAALSHTRACAAELSGPAIAARWKEELLALAASAGRSRLVHGARGR